MRMVIVLMVNNLLGVKMAAKALFHQEAVFCNVSVLRGVRVFGRFQVAVSVHPHHPPVPAAMFLPPLTFLPYIRDTLSAQVLLYALPSRRQAKLSYHLRDIQATSYRLNNLLTVRMQYRRTFLHARIVP
jgi:hypothetical protein